MAASQSPHCPAGTEYSGPFSIGALAGVELRIANHHVIPPATITSMIRMAISGALLLPPGCEALGGTDSTGSTTFSDGTGAGLGGSTTGCVTGAAEITCCFDGTGAEAGFGLGGSATAASGAVTADESAAASRGVPQALQNFAPGVSALPHLAHCSAVEVAAAAGAPHFKQNLAPAGISAPHAAQPAAEAAGIGLPHARQNFPVPPSALQLGHFISDVHPDLLRRLRHPGIAAFDLAHVHGDIHDHDYQFCQRIEHHQRHKCSDHHSHQEDESLKERATGP